MSYEAPDIIARLKQNELTAQDRINLADFVIAVGKWVSLAEVEAAQLTVAKISQKRRDRLISTYRTMIG